VAYDVLWNERHKAVCELRKLNSENFGCGQFMGDLLSAIDPNWINRASTFDEATLNEYMRDRLIHLLGGDQPSGIDVLRAMDAESDTDGTSPNDVRTSSITDELRKFTLSQAMTQRVTPDEQRAARKELQTIADRIDAQFNRICHQQEAVLQETIADVVKEYEHDRLPDQLRIEKLENQRDHWHQQATDMMNHADAMEHERDELRRKVDELESFDPETSIAAFGDDNGKLRRTLSRAATLLANAEQDRDANYAYWMDCKEKVVHANATIEELQAKLDEYDGMHVELPRDENDEVFRVGCTVRMVERHPEVLLTVHSMTLCDDGEWLLYAVSDKDGYSCNLSTSKFEVCEPKSDTAESIVRDLSMGIITELQAIERIEALDD